MARSAAHPHPLPRSASVSGVRLPRDVRSDAARRRSAAAVTEFWAWWAAGGAERAARALDAGEPQRVVPEVTSLVEAIDPGLAWEFGPGGAGATHRLTVTSAGVPELRGAARRWLEHAPAGDGTWGFSDLRDPVDCRALRFRERRLEIDDAEVVVDLGLVRVDVTVHHPAFDGLGFEDRILAAYLLLDAVCGEEAVELWVGRIRANAMVPGGEARPLRELPAVLDELAWENLDSEGAPAWQILHGETPRGPMVAMVRVPPVALSAPRLDLHVAVTVPYSDVEECGLPGVRSLPGLRDLEDHLAGRVAGSGECVAAESCDGRRVLHFYVDSATPAVEQLRVASSGWVEGTVEIEVADDPGWRRVEHLRV